MKTDFEKYTGFLPPKKGVIPTAQDLLRVLYLCEDKVIEAECVGLENLVPGKFIYFSSKGLTQVPPYQEIIQRVGIATSEDRILINIGDSLIIEKPSKSIGYVKKLAENHEKEQNM